MRFNVEQAQNVEQSKKIPCCKSLEEQLEIMELYTDTHRKYSSQGKAAVKREQSQNGLSRLEQSSRSVVR